MLAAMITRTRRPEARSVIALPHFGRYRDLHVDTAASLPAAGIEVWWVAPAGDVSTGEPDGGRRP